MSSDDAAGRQDHLPPDDVPERAEAAFGIDSWADDLADPFADPANLFSAEIENVSVTDWDVDAALIWGDGAGNADPDGGAETLGFDLPF